MDERIDRAWDHEFNIGKSTEAYGHYSTGHLPPAPIDARARRWTVKLFLAHIQQAQRAIGLTDMDRTDPQVVQCLDNIVDALRALAVGLIEQDRQGGE